MGLFVPADTALKNDAMPFSSPPPSTSASAGLGLCYGRKEGTQALNGRCNGGRGRRQIERAREKGREERERPELGFVPQGRKKWRGGVKEENLCLCETTMREREW